MAYLDVSSPADTDPVKQGANSIRTLKGQLNTVLAKIFDNAGNFLTGWITGGQIATGTVATGNLADGAVTQVKLPDGVLSADTAGRAKMADGFITAGKMGVASVTSGAIAADAVTNTILADGTVSTSKVVDGAVTSAKLAAAAVLFANLEASAVGVRVGVASASGFVTTFSGTVGFQPDIVLLFNFGAVVSGITYPVSVIIRAEATPNAPVHGINGNVSGTITATFNSTGFVINSSSSAFSSPNVTYIAIKTH